MKDEYGEKFHLRRIDRPYYNAIASSIAGVIGSIPNSLKKIDSVLDVGCSCGALLRCFSEVPVRCGIDFGISADMFCKDAGKYYDCDFESGFLDTGMKFDLISCLEMIEHISSPASPNVLKTLDCNSDRGSILIFSGAKPGQRGRHHVNCQPSWYWIDRLHSIGFMHDAPLTNNFMSIAGCKMPECYRSNAIIFTKR